MGGKWSLDHLKLYLRHQFPVEVVEKLWRDVDLIITHSLRAVANLVANDKHCFELYGYDIIIDEGLKPWLVEVNASPSLTSTTRADRVMKHG